jgi:uncharacterized protein (TIGR00369 family)
MYDMLLAQLRTAVPFAAHTGVELIALDGEAGRARLAQAPERLNHIATVHAGAIFTLGEAASGAAMAGALAPVLLSARPVASGATIAYLRPARGDLTATARTRRPAPELLEEIQQTGRTTFPVDVTIADMDGTTVATMEVAWHVSTRSTKA